MVQPVLILTIIAIRVFGADAGTIAAPSNETMANTTTVATKATMNETSSTLAPSNETETVAMNALNGTATPQNVLNDTDSTSTTIAMNATLNETTTTAAPSNETVSNTTVAMNATLNETTTTAAPSNETVSNTTTVAMNTTLNETTTTPAPPDETVSNTTVAMNSTLETTTTAPPLNETVSNTTVAMNATLNETTTIPAPSNETVSNTTTVAMNTTLNETTTTPTPSNETVSNMTTVALNATLNETTTIPAPSNETVSNTTTVAMNTTLNETTTTPTPSNETVSNMTTVALNATLNETTTIPAPSNETISNMTTVAINETLYQTTSTPAQSNETVSTTTTVAMNETLNQTTTIPVQSNETISTTTVATNATINQTTTTTPSNVPVTTTTFVTIPAKPSNETLNGTAATPPSVDTSTNAAVNSTAMSTKGQTVAQSTTGPTTRQTTTTLSPNEQPPNYNAAPPHKMTFKIGFDKTWSSDLGIQNSDEFRSFKSVVDQEIDKAFLGCPGYRPFSADVTRFYNVSDGIVATTGALMRSEGVPTRRVTTYNVHADYDTFFENKEILEAGDKILFYIENITEPYLISAKINGSVGVLNSSVEKMNEVASASISGLTSNPCEAIGAYICSLCHPCKSGKTAAEVTCLAKCTGDHQVCTVAGTNTTGCSCKDNYLPVGSDCVHQNVIIIATVVVVGVVLLVLLIAVICLCCCRRDNTKGSDGSYELIHKLVKVDAVGNAAEERPYSAINKGYSRELEAYYAVDTKPENESGMYVVNGNETDDMAPYQSYPYTFGNKLRDEDLPQEMTNSETYLAFVPRLDKIDPHAEYTIPRPTTKL